jgi:hypothetical protein
MERYSRQQKARIQSASVPLPKDQYEPAGEVASGEDRSDLLSAVRKRIKSGYYNSEEVNEDLGDSFAKIFEKLL